MVGLPNGLRNAASSGSHTTAGFVVSGPGIIAHQRLFASLLIGRGDKEREGQGGRVEGGQGGRERDIDRGRERDKQRDRQTDRD